MHTTQQAALTARFLAVFTENDMLFDASNVTVSGGKVTEWVDRKNPTRKFVQGNTALQIATPTTSAAFGGQPVGVFTAGQYYTYNGTAADLTYLTNGTGFEVIAVLSATSGDLIGNANGTANPSIQLEISTNKINYLHRKPWPTATINALSTTLVNTARVVGVSLDVSKTPQYYVRVGNAVEASGTPTTPPTAGSAGVVLALGALGTAFAFLTGSVRSVYFFRRRLQNSERDVVHAYIKATTGL